MDKFADLIGGVKVEEIFNRKKVQKISNLIPRPGILVKKRTDPSCMPRPQCDDKAEARPDIVKKNKLLNSFPYKKRKVIEHKLSGSQSKESTVKEDFDGRRNVFHEQSQSKGASKLGLGKVVKHCQEFEEVIGRPGNEKRRWFKQPPWEERLRKGQELGCLILLNNLDPSCTSNEVEDLIWHTLNEIVEAKMVEWSPTFNPHYGRAFVVFKTKDAAESALSQLNKRCLILGDGRVVSAMKGRIRENSEQTNFPGHFVMDRFDLHKQTEEMKNALSTSHCAQPNTIEYQMAFDWRKLQHKSDVWWNALYQEQKEEIHDVIRRLTIKCNF
ncbi:protein ANTI-SILENCING 1-like [Prosopis cineraria]|uniref:protein ANTI-SILENCING 1-like n=1 Tax=Prosopis cineraria TaxID=364024 RepID=UPI00240F4DDA|nr:protein ANTI-SILENCING 1-like [Prosopis cineraria]